MVRVACILTQRKEDLLLEPWLAYHGSMVGFENLHILADHTASARAEDLLRRCAAAGATLVRQLDGKPPETATGLIERLRAEGRTDVAVALDANEFLVALDEAGPTVSRAPLLAELERVAERPARADHCLETVLGRLDRFRLVPHRPTIVALSPAPAPATAPGPEREANARSRLMVLRLFARPYADMVRAARQLLSASVDLDDPVALGGYKGPNSRVVPYALAREDAYRGHVEPYRYPVVAWSGFRNLLGVLLDREAFERAWGASGSAPDPTPYDLVSFDGHFRASAYMAANPGLPPATVDPFVHYIVGGYREGRRIRADRQGLNEVAVRLAAFRAGDPDRPVGFAGVTAIYRQLQALDEGEAILSAGRVRFPEDAVIAREWAQIALERGEKDEAVRRAEAYRAAFPADGQGAVLAALALRQAERLGEADAAAAESLARNPNDLQMLRLYAEIAALRADFAAAEERYRSIIRLFPNNMPVRSHAVNAIGTIRAARASEEPEVYDMDAPVDVVMTEEETRAALGFLGLPDLQALRALFMSFESLGSSCEFGLVQRRFGAEPLGLLRWNSIHRGNLMDALEERFAALDDKSNVFILNRGSEYILCDRRYRTAMHTFVYDRQMGEAEALQKQGRRISFLKRKLIEDLEEGEKTLVYLDSGVATPDQIEALAGQIARYGPGRLLYVTVASDAADIGQVEVVDDRLLVGRIGRPGRDKNNRWNIDFQAWLAVCRNARDRLAQIEAREGSNA